jgi:hypothetical protein
VVGFLWEVLYENQREAWKRSITPRALSLAANEFEIPVSLEEFMGSAGGCSWGYPT